MRTLSTVFRWFPRPGRLRAASLIVVALLFGVAPGRGLAVTGRAYGQVARGKLGAPKDIRRDVKRVKRQLVDIERRLDDHRERIHELRRTSQMLAVEMRAARRALSEAPSTRGFVPDLQRLGALARLAVARSERNRLAGRILASRQEMFFVLAERDERITRIESLVRKSRRESSEKLTNWSLDGSLITYSADWEAVSLCESNRRWHIDARYDGGLQFHPATWIGFGGGELARYAYEATKKEQIAIAERVLAVQGPKAWPNCFRPLPFHF